jgi:hypothetical protein
MTRLLFVHGIAQEGKSSPILEKEWLAALEKGLSKAGIPPLSSAVTPFYGDKLAGWTKSTSGASIQADREAGIDPDFRRRGAPPEVFSADPDFSKFAVEFAADTVAKAPAVASQAIATGLQSSAANSGNPDFEMRGPQNWPPIVAGIRLLESAMPSLGANFIAHFLKTTHCYLTVNGAFNDINKIVSDALAATDKPTVVVGHSLGSVVSYHVLHAQKSVQVPLFMTLGSPLGIGAIRNRLRTPPKRPEMVKEWYNAFDPQDIVALNPLDKKHFATKAEIENYADVDNDTDNHHGIDGYLDDKIIASKVSSAL